MALYTREEALAHLETVRGRLTPELFERKAEVIRTWTDERPRDLDDSWFTANTLVAVPTSSEVASEGLPGEMLSTVLQMLGWGTLLIGGIGAAITFARASEFGSDVTMSDAFGLVLTTVLGGTLLLAAAAVLQLLARIVTELRQAEG